MPVTKEIYSANAPWTQTSMADMLRDALIDAGLMTAWHDSFTKPSSTDQIRVLKIEHNGTKTYGSCFYSFVFNSSGACGLYLSSGWNASGAPPVNVPTGTQYLDYYALPANYFADPTYSSRIFGGSTTSNLFLDRYTSQDDSKQSWFVFRQGSNVSKPFTILHKDTGLHSWLNLDQGVISGFHRVSTQVSNRAGAIGFTVESAIRRCLCVGAALRGSTDRFSYNDLGYTPCSYLGLGSQSGQFGSNFPDPARNSGVASAIVLPVGKSSANPAFVTDYVPICTDLPWSPWTPTTLAADFGIYMHYNDNTIGYGDRFIVQSALNEWQVLSFANNANVNDGATATFVARII
jgi:hypothetical protein